MIDRAVLKQIVSAGISASSADNSQPWRLTLRDDGVALGLDERHLGMFFDPGLAASLISCGGVCELMSIAATRHGLRADITMLPEHEHPGRIAEIRFSPDESLGLDPLSGAVAWRTAHRGHYRRWRAVDKSLLAAAESEVSRIPGHRVSWCDAGQRRIATRQIYLADTIRFAHREVHEQFFQQLRFGEASERELDGLAANTLGIERVFIPVLRATRSWGIASSLNRIGWNYVMALRGAWVPCLTASGLGALIQDREQGYFAAGRAFHRLWLSLNQAGLAFQPLGALPLFLMRLEDLDGIGFDAAQKAKLSSMQGRLPSFIEGYDAARHRLVMLFRYGYPVKPAPRSLRRPLEDFING
jgi:hypothetical protein